MSSFEALFYLLFFDSSYIVWAIVGVASFFLINSIEHYIYEHRLK